MSEIEGFDEDIAIELRQRARDFLESQQEEAQTKLKELGVTDDLLEFDALPINMLKELAIKGIKTLDDLADLASDEFAELLPNAGLDEDQINAIIMKAREHWFEGEETPEAEVPATKAEATTGASDDSDTKAESA